MWTFQKLKSQERAKAEARKYHLWTKDGLTEMFKWS